jgi:hypothetical protein
MPIIVFIAWLAIFVLIRRWLVPQAKADRLPARAVAAAIAGWAGAFPIALVLAGALDWDPLVVVITSVLFVSAFFGALFAISRAR